MCTLPLNSKTFFKKKLISHGEHKLCQSNTTITTKIPAKQVTIETLDRPSKTFVETAWPAYVDPPENPHLRGINFKLLLKPRFPKPVGYVTCQCLKVLLPAPQPRNHGINFRVTRVRDLGQEAFCSTIAEGGGGRQEQTVLGVLCASLW